MLLIRQSSIYHLAWRGVSEIIIPVSFVIFTGSPHLLSSYTIIKEYSKQSIYPDPWPEFSTMREHALPYSALSSKVLAVHLIILAIMNSYIHQ